MAVLAAEAPLGALLLHVALLLAEADQAFARRALGQQERAESFVAALATEGAKRPESARRALEARPTRPADATPAVAPAPVDPTVPAPKGHRPGAEN